MKQMPEDIGKFPGNLNEESVKKIDSAASVQLVFCSSHMFIAIHFFQYVNF